MPLGGNVRHCKVRCIRSRAADFISDPRFSRSCCRLHAGKRASHNEQVAASALHRWSRRAESPHDFGSPNSRPSRRYWSKTFYKSPVRGRREARCETGHKDVQYASPSISIAWCINDRQAETSRTSAFTCALRNTCGERVRTLVAVMALSEARSY
jgi:hypothetical protein